MFRAGDDRVCGDGLVGEDGDRSTETLIGSALWGRWLMGRGAFSRDTEVPGLSFIETPPAASFSSSELLARLRVPR